MLKKYNRVQRILKENKSSELGLTLGGQALTAEAPGLPAGAN